MWDIIPKKCMDIRSDICCNYQGVGIQNNIFVWAEQEQFDHLDFPRNKNSSKM